MAEFTVAASPVLLQVGGVGVPAVGLGQVHPHERRSLGANFRSPIRLGEQTTYFGKPTHEPMMNSEMIPLKLFLL